MAPVILRRTRAGTLSAALNLALALVTGVVVLGNQWVADQAHTGWIVTGVALLAWAGVILSALLRPVLAVADAQGLALRRLFGWHRLPWDVLVWADFDTSARAVIVAARVAGHDRFAALPKRPVTDDDLTALRQAVATMRPGLPARKSDHSTRPETA